jgi:crotonobetainyl-CoA:carnitine CoA-transferase CaiB-like acyl-CoA transferase
MTGPLDGYRIVDCAAYITGPLAAMILGDQGADVIKVEPVGFGDLMRHVGTSRAGIGALFAGCNRSKRSISLDLREPRGRELLERLVEGADVFVQNFRPGVVERLGIDEPALRKRRPDLVYVSISAFGHTGPWSGKPAFDHVIQAAAGFAGVQADRESGEPRFIQNAVVDKVTAYTAAQAITAALLHRERTGEGRHVRLSMLDSALSFLWPDGMANETLLGEGVDLKPAVATAYRMVQVRDGHVAVAVMTPEQLHGLFRAVDRPEFIEDPRFSTINALLQNLDALMEETAVAALEQTVAESVAALEREDVPCAPVSATHEIAEHPQVRASQSLEELDHPSMGRMRRPRPAARFSEEPHSASRHAPRLGEHTDEILADLGLSPTEITDLRAKGIAG